MVACILDTLAHCGGNGGSTTRAAITARATHRIAPSAASTDFCAMSSFMELMITTAEPSWKRFCWEAMLPAAGAEAGVGRATTGRREDR